MLKIPNKKLYAVVIGFFLIMPVFISSYSGYSKKLSEPTMNNTLEGKTTLNEKKGSDMDNPRNKEMSDQGYKNNKYSENLQRFILNPTDPLLKFNTRQRKTNNFIKKLNQQARNHDFSNLSYTIQDLQEECIQNNSVPSSLFSKNSPNILISNNTENAYKKGEIILKFTSDVSLSSMKYCHGFLQVGIDSVDTLSEKFELIFKEQVFKDFTNINAIELGLQNIVLCKVPEDEDIVSVIETYERNDYIEYAQPNYIMQQDKIPNDPYYHSSESWSQSFDDLYGIKIINCQDAWDRSIGSKNIIVAVLDTGVDYNHEDIHENMWINPDEIASNGIDDDDDGFIDNIYGADFSNNDSNPMDGYGHGTHCAGIIAATGNNSIGIVGVNWKTSIMAVKGLSDYGGGYSDTLAKAMCWATDQGADIISNSWGPSSQLPSNPIMEDAVRYVYGLGCIIVFSAGNSDDDVQYYSPKNMNETITVAATDYKDQKADFSNWGEKVDVCAPGVDILSLRANDTGSSSSIIGENYYLNSGTSMACPHVAGLVALLLSINESWDTQKIRSILKNTGDLQKYPLIGTRINANRACMADIAKAEISFPQQNPDCKGFLQIQGITWAQDFNYFTLEYGKEFNPDSWLLITNSSFMIDGGILGILDTTLLPEGLYMLRLQVHCLQGIVTYFSWFVINNKHDKFTVSPLGTGDYISIQNAIDHAGANDTIYIGSGYYNEQFLIDRPLVLNGKEDGSSVINTDQSKRTIHILESFVTISDVIILGCYGIEITQAEHVRITGCQLFSDFGIVLKNAKDCTIDHNFIVSSYGIYGLESKHNRILNNFFIGRYGYFFIISSYLDLLNNQIYCDEIDIILSNTDHCVINNNTMTTTGIYMMGDKMHHWNTHTISENNLQGKPIYYIKNKRNYAIYPTDFGQLILANCSSSTIENITINDLFIGITIGYSENNTFQRCIFEDNEFAGVFICASQNFTFINCSFKQNYYGLFLILNTSQTQIQGTTFSDNYVGCYLADHVTNNTIENCIFSKNNRGLYLYNASDNMIINNTIKKNIEDGLYLMIGSHRNIIAKNTITDNSYGIYIDNWGNSSDNTMYHNYFENHDSNANDYCYNNWDHSILKEGNYWHDYQGTDENLDNRGDTPYDIPGGNNLDNYVLGLFHPNSKFSYSFNTSQIVQFTDQSTDSDGTIIQWKWYFGDGKSSMKKNPTHTFIDLGWYDVTLTIFDDDGKNDSTSKTIEIVDTVPPTLTIIHPKQALYIRDTKIIDLQYLNSIIIGSITVSVDASDDFSGLDHVKFYINDELVSTVNSVPYEFTWESQEKRIFHHKYILRIDAVDFSNNQNSTELTVWRFF